MNLIRKNVSLFVVRGLKLKIENEKRIETYSGHNKITKCYGFGVTATGALGIKDNIVPGRNPKLLKKIAVSLPIRIKYFHEKQLNLKKVACGYGFSLFLSSKGSNNFIHGTGINSDGQLGSHSDCIVNDNYGISVNAIPAEISFENHVDMKKYKLTNAELAAGRAHSLISCEFQNRTQPNEKICHLFSLGNNSFGQCGRKIIPGEVFSNENSLVYKLNLPEEIFPIKKVVCGQDHSLILTSSGHVYSCGIGSDGQTGLGTYDNIDSFSRVLGSIENVKIKDLSSKGDTVLALSECNKLFIWGNNEYGQIFSANYKEDGPYKEFKAPPPDYIQYSMPVELNLSHENIIVPEEAGIDSKEPDMILGKINSIACTGSMCAFLDSYGKVFVWGFGFPGLGPDVNYTPRPTLIPPGLFAPAFAHSKDPRSHLTNLTSGLHHFIAYSTTLGQAFSWGTSRSGISCLGIGNDSFSDVKAQTYPEKIIIPASVTQVDCGVDHTIVLAESFD